LFVLRFFDSVSIANKTLFDNEIRLADFVDMLFLLHFLVGVSE